MKRLLSRRVSHYGIRVCVFLSVMALAIGMVACVDSLRTLAITSTDGGSVTTPGEGAFTYDVGTVVNLVAEAEPGYRFTCWTGDVGSIEDAAGASSTIHMKGNYRIIANFEEMDPGTLFAGGNGTAEDPYQIANWSHLHNVRDYMTDHFILTNNLLSTTAGYADRASPTANHGKGWEPIGGVVGLEPPGGGFEDVDAFTGTFDGQGYEIEDLFMNRPDEHGIGLFCAMEHGGVIESVGLTNCAVTGDWVVGGLVGMSLGGNVSNSYSSGNVIGNGRVGGLIGRCAGITTVSYSYSSGTVTGGWCTGGLVGSNSGGILKDSHSAAWVSGSAHVGGLVGINWEEAVRDSYSTGAVTGQTNVGGLVGWNYHASVSNSYAAGMVTGGYRVGGLVGHSEEGSVTNSFWDTETSGQATSDGGTGKTTAEMQSISTFLGAVWDIAGVADSSNRTLAYVWNIVNDETYPFLSWEPVS